MPDKLNVKKDMYQLLKTVNKLHKDVKSLKLLYDEKNTNNNEQNDISERLKSLEKTVTCADNLSKNIKDYIDFKVECSIEDALENINNKFNLISNQYKKIISQLTHTSNAYRD